MTVPKCGFETGHLGKGFIMGQVPKRKNAVVVIASLLQRIKGITVIDFVCRLVLQKNNFLPCLDSPIFRIKDTKLCKKKFKFRLVSLNQ